MTNDGYLDMTRWFNLNVNKSTLHIWCVRHFFDGYTIRYMRMLWPNQKKNVECTPTPLLIIINDSFSEIYFYGNYNPKKSISNILNLFISQSGQQRGTLHFSQNLTSVEVLSLRLCRYLYFRRNCRILIRQQQSQGVVPPYFLPCMEKRHEWMDSIWPAAP